MIIQKFEDIESWKIGQDLAEKIYLLCENFRDFGFRDQITRATISISNNIAEGFERKGNNEFRRFLYIAKGSCAEVRSMLYIGKRLGYYSESEFQELYNLTISITKLMTALINSLRDNA